MATTKQASTPEAASAGGEDPKNNNSNSTRLSKTTACLPIVHGSIAFYLGKKADEFQTHEWTLFVRGPHHEDLSPAIAKVVFQLHPSFAQPVRELTQPPFEVTERGWGEFEAQIRIVWTDPSEKATVINHALKLYPPGSPPNVLPKDENAPPVIAESYDEVVFTDPNENFFRQLLHIPKAPKVESSQQEWLTECFADETDFLTLAGAQKFLEEELETVKERFQVVSEEYEVVDREYTAAMQKHQQQQAANKKSKGGGGKRTTKKARTS
ncbi:unnamed protein product [Cylindrotheca closterium]|uniref:YEATS domain-containing protein n=1 Tax=Cylindrotheca closterium TaxID=2856 RepID=A0AAD2CS24_9STRA|nr:unnamed protein product [Cylindrotheca closterium]